MAPTKKLKPFSVSDQQNHQVIFCNKTTTTESQRLLHHWSFLDEIEAPMWVDLSSEVTGTSHENDDDDDEWFLMTHQYHQCSSRKLISALSRGEFSTKFVSELQESCSPKLLPPSVSKSRGKHYKSREWAHNSCTFTTKKHSVKTISSKLSQVTSGDVKKIKHQLGDEISNKCGLLPAGVDCEKTVNEAAGSSTSRMNTSFCYSKTDSGLTPSREGEKNSISTVTSESTEQNEKSYEVSRQTKGQSSKLLSSLRISLRKSCVTRPAARMDINRVRKSVDPKSSSSQSSVGSSSHSGHKSNNMTPRGMQHNDKTPFSRNAIGISQVPKNILKGPSILKASPVLRYVTSISGQKIESDVHKSVNQETSKAKVRNFLVHPQVSLPLRMHKQDRLIASRAKGKVQVSEQYKRFTGAGKENMAEQTTKSVNLLGKPKVSGVMAQVQNASNGRLPVKKDVAKQKNISCRSGLQTSANMVKKVYLR